MLHQNLMLCKKKKCILNDEHLDNICSVEELIEICIISNYKSLSRSTIIKMLHDVGNG